MSSNEELWDQLGQRVARSQVGGVSAEDDDQLAAADIIEALINPHRGAQAGATGMNAPGMMPPMMMGGMGGAGSGSAGGTPVGATQTAQGPVAAGGQRTAAAAGIPGEARTVERGPGGSGVGGGSVGGGGGRSGGGAGIPGDGSGAGPLAAGSVEEPAGPVDDLAPASEVSSAVGATGEGPTIGTGSGSAVDPGMPFDGFSVDPTIVRALAERWTALAEQVGAISDHPEASMGLFEQAQRPHQALIQQLNAWRRGAVDEFDAVATRLHNTAAQYESVDADGVAEIRYTGGMNPWPPP